MIRILFLGLLLAGIFSCKNDQKMTEMESVSISRYYFIRHAEKDRTDSAEKDPTLNADGIKRAKYWVKYFDSIPLSSAYSTNFKRTQETVMYVAANKNLDVISYDPNTILNTSFLDSTKGKHVLIVGHSNTTPMLVNQMLGESKYGEMDDWDNSSLYVVTVKNGEVQSEIRTVHLPQEQ